MRTRTLRQLGAVTHFEAWAPSARQTARITARRPPPRRPLHFLALESRSLLSAGVGIETCIELEPGLDALPPLLSPPSEYGASSGGSGGKTVLAASSPLSSIPVLNSNPGAPATVYLKFDGDFTASWGGYSNITTPVFDQDGDSTSFSDGELETITNVWQQVSEDYSPFNVNVTTVAPPNLNNGVAQQVDIGGDGSWTGGTYGGIAYTGSFTNSNVNVSFVFPSHLGGGYWKYVGDASSHESGHAFGLSHQSQYSGTTRTAEYYSGPGDGTAPIMGNSYGSPLSRWWYGTSTSSTTMQDDLAVISSTTNGFGYRVDDVGGTAGTSSPLLANGSQVSGSGIIGSTSDLDVFSFHTGAGSISLSVGGPAGKADLAPKIEIRDATGASLIASAGPNSNSVATISLTVSLGNYRLVVASNGGYGNIGQFAVTGTIIDTPWVNAPTSLVATSTSTTNVNLSWSDNATNETGYNVERSTDGGASWAVIASALPANSTGFADSTVSAGTSYAYRVDAFNASVTSDYSNVPTVTTIPAAPAGLVASAQSSSSIALSWNNLPGENGFQVKRSTDGINWTVVGSVGRDVVSYIDTSLTAGTTYRYVVLAFNLSGYSAASNVATATTLTAPVAPAAPSNLAATVTSSTTVLLTWRDNSGNEDTFLVERSTNNGKSWSQIARLGANVTNFTDATVSPRKSYSYRVRATNVSGNSPYSNVAQVTMPAKGSSGAEVILNPPVIVRTGSRPMFMLKNSLAPYSALTRTALVDRTIAQWTTPRRSRWSSLT